jgi:hypothetical protein
MRYPSIFAGHVKHRPLSFRHKGLGRAAKPSRWPATSFRRARGVSLPVRRRRVPQAISQTNGQQCSDGHTDRFSRLGILRRHFASRGEVFGYCLNFKSADFVVLYPLAATATAWRPPNTSPLRRDTWGSGEVFVVFRRKPLQYRKLTAKEPWRRNRVFVRTAVASDGAATHGLSSAKAQRQILCGLPKSDLRHEKSLAAFCSNVHITRLHVKRTTTFCGRASPQPLQVVVARKIGRCKISRELNGDPGNE